MAEHESKIQVVRFAGMWKDLGTWNTLTEAMDESIIGKGELNDKCSGVHIINEMDVPVLAIPDAYQYRTPTDGALPCGQDGISGITVHGWLWHDIL